MNLKLLGNVVVACSFAAFIAHLLLTLTRVEGISWMPDRDSMTNYGDSIARDIFGLNFHALCGYHGTLERYNRVKVLVGKESKDGEMWFDELVRVPDYISGTIASWDITNQKIIGDHPKFNQVLNRGIANNRFVAVINVAFPNATIQTEALRISRTP